MSSGVEIVVTSMGACFDDDRSVVVKVVPDPQHSHLIEVWEPLTAKVPNPNLTRVWCCYINTVIFYVRPVVMRPWSHFWVCNRERRATPPNSVYEEWGRVETVLRIDSTIEFEGRKFRIYNGRVVWKNKQWWMKREARAVKEAA